MLNSITQCINTQLRSPDDFWAEQAEKFISWNSRWDRVSDVDFSEGKIAWFEGATLNVSYNCLDRHLPERANQVAIIWEGMTLILVSLLHIKSSMRWSANLQME
jgi:hypothetical protein